MTRAWKTRTSRSATAAAWLAATLACCLVAALVPGSAAADEGGPTIRVSSPTPSTTAGVPATASAGTRAALKTAEQRLTDLQVAVTQTAADYHAATARLSLARQAVAAGDRAATLAAQATADATVQVGQYAASAYMGGPMAGAASVFNSTSAADLLHVTSMLDVIGDNQVGAVQRLERGRAEALAASERARVGRDAARDAEADATRLSAQATTQLTQTVALLEALHARADKEVIAERARRLEAARAAARAAALSPTGGLGDLPPGALGVGPVAGLPDEAGPDPGDGEPGADHLRPRAERARWLVIDLFGITDIGGWRPSDAVSGDHPSGRAIDCMMTTLGTLPDPTRVALGWRLARWAQSNAVGLGVTYVIWQGRIWSVARAAEGWRDYTVNFPYGSTVNPTTLHMDHVHISFG